MTMDTRITEALVDLGEACSVMVSIRTLTGEAVVAISAGTTIAARVASTLINVNVTHGTCMKQGNLLSRCSRCSIISSR